MAPWAACGRRSYLSTRDYGCEDHDATRMVTTLGRTFRTTIGKRGRFYTRGMKGCLALVIVGGGLQIAGFLLAFYELIRTQRRDLPDYPRASPCACVAA